MSNNRAPKSVLLNRRSFVAMTGAAIAGSAVRGISIKHSSSPRLAVVAAAGVPGRIESYTIHGTIWKLLHSVQSEAPVSLAVHPIGNVLYALHEVQEFQGLPRGYVESYRIHRDSGRLTLLSQQPLSLSATNPRHLAITPNGKSLIASIHGGGAYNLLPILPNGAAGRVCTIRKETGHGPSVIHQRSAHPQAVIHNHNGQHIFAADLGTDTLSILEPESLRVLTRLSLPPGSGPRHLALHPSGRFVFVACALNGSLHSIEYLPSIAQFRTAQHSMQGNFGGPLTFDPTGRILYATGSNNLEAFRVREQTGAFHPIHRVELPSAIAALTASPAGDKLFAATEKNVLGIETSIEDAPFGSIRPATNSPGIRSIVLL